MEFKNMNVDELIERRDALVAGLDAEDADLDAIEEEVRAIKAELEERKATAKKKADICDMVASGAGEVKDTFEKVEERKTMDLKEIRNSKEYIDAFARYIKSEDDRECRGIITENGGLITKMTNIPVPEIVDDIIGTAWANNKVLSRVRKLYFKGNLKVGIEVTSSDAVFHEEGDTAPFEESLTLSIEQLIPVTIKKWISISDEAVDMGGEAFLRYVYDELTYRILKKLEDSILDKIINSNYTAVVPGSASTSGLVSALAMLAGEAVNPVAIMSRATWAIIKNTSLSANYAYDPFQGLEVLFNDSLQQKVIVGDLSGVTVNYPAGDDVKIKYDDLSQAPADMIRVIGRQYVAYGVTKPGHFAVIGSNED